MLVSKLIEIKETRFCNLELSAIIRVFKIFVWFGIEIAEKF